MEVGPVHDPVREPVRAGRHCGREAAAVRRQQSRGPLAQEYSRHPPTNLLSLKTSFFQYFPALEVTQSCISNLYFSKLGLEILEQFLKGLGTIYLSLFTYLRKAFIISQYMSSDILGCFYVQPLLK